MSNAACACTSLRRATRSVTAAYDDALKPSGLRVTQFSVLRALARLGPLSVSNLAREAVLDRSTMGRNLDPLERRGFVVMTAGAKDGRERIARLTPAGEAAIAAAVPYWEIAQARVAALVPEAALAALAEMLRPAGSP